MTNLANQVDANKAFKLIDSTLRRNWDALSYEDSDLLVRVARRLEKKIFPFEQSGSLASRILQDEWANSFIVTENLSDLRAS